MEPIAASELIAKVREKVAEDPERKYDTDSRNTGLYSCVYQFADGTLGCLVGQGLIPLMGDKEFFNKNPSLNTSTVCDLFETGVIEGTEDERLWLQILQARQDSGDSWGHCLAEADKIYPLN